jgi:putative redox protein
LLLRQQWQSAIKIAEATMIDCETERPGEFPQKMVVRARHQLHADVDEATGGHDGAPGAHDYFDAALAACKTLTATWYARRHGIPLERVESHVERDDTGERKGTYRLKVRLAFHGPLDQAQRDQLYNAVAHCPIHKLMTTTDVVIETEPLT